MPVNDKFVGVYDVVFIGGNAVIAEKANRNRQMQADGETLIQGTPKQRILNIGPVTEDFDIDGPILIGGGQAVDTRNLMSRYLKQILTPQETNDNVEPPVLLTSASISVNEGGGNISLRFKSDGNPNNQSFRVYGDGGDNLPGANPDPLNPSTQKPTRKARFFDFRVNLGGYKYFIIDFNLNVTIEVEEKYFIAGIDPSNETDPTPGSGANDSPPWNPTNNPNNWGTQFPWLFIKGIKLEGGGTAAVKKIGKDLDGFWNDAINVGFAPEDYELTLQAPGAVVDSAETFAVQVFEIDYVGNPNAISGAWVNLFRDPDNPGEDLMDLSKSVIKSAKFSESPGVLTVAFTFVCWVI